MPPAFAPRSTGKMRVDEKTKTLLYAHHGFGKTTQCKFYQEHYGPGFIFSGEGGLKSLVGSDIDYLPFSSWDGQHNPEEEVYSFKGIVRMTQSDEFKAMGYRWIAIDSLTELSDLCLRHFEKEVEAERIKNQKDKKDGFAVWNQYNAALIGALKWVRDLDMHVLVTALAKEEEDANGNLHYWPMVQGKGVMKQIPGMFDNVFCGVRSAEPDPATGRPRIKRFFITEEANGWHGKARDPLHRAEPVENTDRMTDIFKKMNMTDEQYREHMKTKEKDNAVA